MEYIDFRKAGREGLKEMRRQVVRLKKRGNAGKEIEELTGVRQNRAKDDPLGTKEILTADDLAGQTFMVGGGSPPDMVVVQNRIGNSGQVHILNCPDHETALANVAARKGIVMTLGFANDHSGEFLWVPFDCPEHIKCVLGYHRDDVRESTRYFIELAQAAYTHADAIPL